MAVIPNVVIFGETGVGKSSLINLIAGNDIAPVANGAVGLTYKSTCYPAQIGGLQFNLYDTAGLGDGDEGTVFNDAIVQLYTLLRRLDTGVSLLVFCMRGPRIKISCVKNWRLLREIICQMRVPILLAVTGLEYEEPMDNWWTENEEHFIAYNIYPSGVACVTATRGRQMPDGAYRFGEEYKESQVKIRRSIHMAHLHHPWRVPPAEWFIEISYRGSGKSVETSLGSATKELMGHCWMTAEEAHALAQSLSGI